MNLKLLTEKEALQVSKLSTSGGDIPLLLNE